MSLNPYLTLKTIIFDPQIEHWWYQLLP